VVNMSNFSQEGKRPKSRPIPPVEYRDKLKKGIYKGKERYKTLLPLSPLNRLNKAKFDYTSQTVLDHVKHNGVWVYPYLEPLDQQTEKILPVSCLALRTDEYGDPSYVNKNPDFQNLFVWFYNFEQHLKSHIDNEYSTKYSHLNQFYTDTLLILSLLDQCHEKYRAYFLQLVVSSLAGEIIASYEHAILCYYQKQDQRYVLASKELKHYKYDSVFDIDRTLAVYGCMLTLLKTWFPECQEVAAAFQLMKEITSRIEQTELMRLKAEVMGRIPWAYQECMGRELSLYDIITGKAHFQGYGPKEYTDFPYATRDDIWQTYLKYLDTFTPELLTQELEGLFPLEESDKTNS
jgi:hypothetical protein